MELLRIIRRSKALSQRRFAALAGISCKTIQLIESGRHDPKLSTLEALANAVGLPARLLRKKVESVFALPNDSIAVISERMAQHGENSWRVWLFNFVDAFRAGRNEDLMATPPVEDLSPKMRALFASATEALCAEAGLSPPWWCGAVPPLHEPWFVSGVENLKATALVESPAYFRRRNIFVLSDFLSRA